MRAARDWVSGLLDKILSQDRYFGITHHWPYAFLDVWRVVGCRRGWHLWDEVGSGSGEHYLSCDSCDLMLHMGAVEVTYVKQEDLVWHRRVHAASLGADGD